MPTRRSSGMGEAGVLPAEGLAELVEHVDARLVAWRMPKSAFG